MAGKRGSLGKRHIKHLKKHISNNRLLYSLIAFGVLIVVAVSVYATTTISNTGITTPSFNVTNSTGSSLFYINSSNGHVGIGTIAPSTTLDVNGTATVQNLLNLTVITLPACGASTNGTIGRNESGVYGCNATGSWKKIF